MPDKAHKGWAGPVDVIVKPDIIFVGMESKSVGIVVVGEGNGCSIVEETIEKNVSCTIPPLVVTSWTHQWYWVYQWYFLPRKH
jgi:hypothetical protein